MAPDLSRADWRKATVSQQGSECVEVAALSRGAGPVLPQDEPSRQS
jgi:hypothetical protein